jgi:hypothetical protein
VCIGAREDEELDIAGGEKGRYIVVCVAVNVLEIP